MSNADRHQSSSNAAREAPLWEQISADSYLEYTFVRWVLTPAMHPAIHGAIVPQHEVTIGDHTYRVDYLLRGAELTIAVELDGFAYHGDRDAFTYDRLRQNDLQLLDWRILRFSYDAIRLDTRRCVEQLQALARLDPLLQHYLIADPVVRVPEMNPHPLAALAPAPGRTSSMPTTYFDSVRGRLNLQTLRACQHDAFGALTNYYRDGGRTAACVMSVGAGKTVLGVLTALAFARRRAMIITPGSVIRGTFDRALNHTALGNALYGLPAGPLIPGSTPPRVITLDRESGPIRAVTREMLLEADILLTNFHALGSGDDPDDLLAKLSPADVDLIIVDEAHIAAAESYQRVFRHFHKARTLLMSACFQRLDGKPIDADVVYRYRLIDSIADGNAKNLRVHRFAPAGAETTYEMIWPDGSREEIIGREALLAVLKDERKIANITAKSDTPIRQIMRIVRACLDEQAARLAPIKPRVLFAALGERHAEQIARIAEEYGIPCATLHHTMSESRIKAVRDRFEQESGDLQGVVQLKMLGQGYDHPPITIVVPMRPYGSFNEFYQFVGRGIRVLQHPALTGRVKPGEQFLDLVYHAELGLDDHVDTIYRENDMDPSQAYRQLPSGGERPEDIPGTRGRDVAERPEAFVVFERGLIEQRIVHDAARIERRRAERELEALMQGYAAYAKTTSTPASFEQYVSIMRSLSQQPKG
jgi:superfamily II DNA or RNA helicase